MNLILHFKTSHKLWWTLNIGPVLHLVLFYSLTLLLVFLPGAQLYSFRRRWVKEKWRWRWRLACLLFPITLIFFKVGLPLENNSLSLFNLHPFIFQAALFLNPSSMMMGVNIRMTACEATLESLLQLSLQLFIIFLRSDTMPSLLQVGCWWEQGFVIPCFLGCHHLYLFVHGVFGCVWRFHSVDDKQGNEGKYLRQVLHSTQLPREGQQTRWEI